jgi:hypothetical protein
MLIVSSFLILMPLWAVFWADDREVVTDQQDVAKVVTDPVFLSNGRAPTEIPIDHSGQTEEHAASSYLAATPHVSTVDDATGQVIRRLEERLRQLGAEYMLLGYNENPPPDSCGSYRFLCRMPIPNHPLYSRRFESTADDPVVAMRHVLQNVELWQSAREQYDDRVMGRRSTGTGAFR